MLLNVTSGPSGLGMVIYCFSFIMARFGGCLLPLFSFDRKIPIVGTVITPILQTRQPSHRAVSNFPPAWPHSLSHRGRSFTRSPGPRPKHFTLHQCKPFQGGLGFCCKEEPACEIQSHGQWFRNHSSRRSSCL